MIFIDRMERTERKVVVKGREGEGKEEGRKEQKWSLEREKNGRNLHFNVAVVHKKVIVYTGIHVTLSNID